MAPAAGWDCVNTLRIGQQDRVAHSRHTSVQVIVIGHWSRLRLSKDFRRSVPPDDNLTPVWVSSNEYNEDVIQCIRFRGTRINAPKIGLRIPHRRLEIAIEPLAALLEVQDL